MLFALDSSLRWNDEQVEFCFMRVPPAVVTRFSKNTNEL